MMVVCLRYYTNQAIAPPYDDTKSDNEQHLYCNGNNAG